MKESKNNPELKIRKIKRDYKNSCRASDRSAELFFVLFSAGVILWTIMHLIFDACIDSWMADPEINNFRYMWNILMYLVPYTLWALSFGFFVTGFLSPLFALTGGSIRIFLLKRRMRRENYSGECNDDAAH